MFKLIIVLIVLVTLAIWTGERITDAKGYIAVNKALGGGHHDEV